MYSPKLRPPVMYEVTKSRQSVDEGSPFCNIRCWLIVWAMLRLLVSIFWTSIISIATLATMASYFTDEKSPHYGESPYMLVFEIPAIISQLVEFGMLITFIVAGFKKSAELYTHYYRYCIITVAIYIVCVSSYLVLGYNYGHFAVEIYLTYHFDDLFDMFAIAIDDDTKIFLFTAIIDVCLEMLLIRFVKKLIKRYEDNDDCATV
ncbi:uncharacterized protein LOC124636515 [Helicoverpa zea]|uniref:uncharacterized protein LOC124636515 n=1 Tax=Helicoverpa zea TaxID=7113 RepID=UPI001F58340A|nr:uncharacterized protein LOC124636515 [Helicoverpa zea]